MLEAVVVEGDLLEVGALELLGDERVELQGGAQPRPNLTLVLYLWRKKKLC